MVGYLILSLPEINKEQLYVREKESGLGGS